MYDAPVRTTLSIDDDVLFAARSLAEREGRSVGDVVSSLARQGLAGQQPVRRVRNGIPLLPRKGKGRPVTMELVNQLRDELP